MSLALPRRSRFQVAFLLATWAGWGLHSPWLAAQTNPWRPVPDLGLQVLAGFRVTLFAPPDLAPNVSALTVDAHDRVWITGPGYLRVLWDEDRDGQMDDGADFFASAQGGQGLWFAGSDLFWVGDQGLYRFADQDGDGRPDPDPERLLPLNTGFDGGHGGGLGPDGWHYLVGGLESGLDRSLPGSMGALVSTAQGGAVIRLPPNGRRAEILAHGLRNPCDLAFHAFGDLFTWDNDQSSDYPLPWYRPSQLLRVGAGNDEGWRSAGLNPGWGWTLPAGHPASLPPTTEMVHGNVTGLVCYRHFQFPEPFRNGLIAADWVWGRVFAVQLRPAGSGYDAQIQPLLEAAGRHAFAPTDLAVAWDGSVLISAGGRKSGGGIYRLQYVGDPDYYINATNWAAFAGSDFDLVMAAPQPDASWSRRFWAPLALNLGPAPFEQIAALPQADPLLRIRATEVLTELFEGFNSRDAAVRTTQADDPGVRARAAWSLGRQPQDGDLRLLLPLTADLSPYVRRQALEVLLGRDQVLDMTALQQVLALNLPHPDPEIRLAAARLARGLTPPAWEALWARRSQLPPAARLSLIQARFEREPVRPPDREAIQEALALLKTVPDPAVRQAALHLLGTSLGLPSSPVEGAPWLAYYRLTQPPAQAADLLPSARATVSGLFPSGQRGIDLQAARVLGALESDEPDLPRRILARITPRTEVGDDLHYLLVTAQLLGDGLTNITAELTGAILALESKWPKGYEAHWQPPWTQATRDLMFKIPALADALARDARLPRPAHLPLVALLPDPLRIEAARSYLRAVRTDPQFPWTKDLVGLLSTLPDRDIPARLRDQWASPALREALVVALASPAEVGDRDKFLWALDSPRQEVVQAAVSALEKLPRHDRPRSLVPLGKALYRAMDTAGDPDLRRRIVALLARQAGRTFPVSEGDGSSAALARGYQPVFNWLQTTHPELVRPASGSLLTTPAAWALKFKTVRWTEGDPQQGKVLFEQLGCAFCHTGSPLLGPDLRGTAARTTVEALWDDIVFPNRHLSPSHGAVVIETIDGQRWEGALLFDSPEWLLLRTRERQTLRLSMAEIRQRYPSHDSFMPDGLVEGLEAARLADLYAFLVRW